jgi:uncharacterized protein YneR
LTATGNDPNGDAITYCWEEYDLGPASPPDSDADGQARPIFRSFPPTTNPSRTFPSLQYILNNANVPPATIACGDGFRNNCIAGEVLPSIARTMNFQVTVRDNRATGGGISSAQMQVVVDGNSGPLAVTQPNGAATWAPGSQQMVTWNVANTNNAPVSCANVKILLSTDGGQTFPTTLADSVPNNGAATITVPNNMSTAARVKVEAVGNIFFDISDANFTIGMGGPPPPADTVALMSGAAQNGTVPAPTGGVVLGQTQYTIQVPAGTAQLKVDLNGNQNVDLYVRFGQRVVLQGNAAVADVKAETPGGTETITITPTTAPALQAGTYYIGVGNNGPGAATFTVTATVTAGGGGGDPNTVALTSGVAQNGMIPAPEGGGGRLGTTQYTIQVPAGATQLKVDLNGTQDVDLFVRFGQRVVNQNGMAIADFKSEGATGMESLTITPGSTPPLQAGTYYIAVSNYGPDASTFTITATVQ